jgi:hypothetical protein
MSDTSNDKKINNDEIDLLDLFRKMGRTLSNWIAALLKALLVSIIFMLRRWLPLGLSIIAGIVVSVLLRSGHSSLYTSDLVLKNNLVQYDKKMRDISGTNSELIAKINKLHTFCVAGNFEALSRSLQVDPTLGKNISDISAFWIIDLGRDGIPDIVDYQDSHNVYDTVNVRVPNTIDVQVKFAEGIDLNSVRDGIIKFIDQDSLNQQRNKLRHKQNIDLLSRFNYDIAQLDSLQKVKYFEETRRMMPAKDGQIVFMQDQKTQLLYPDVQYLYDKKQVIEKDLNIYNNIVTVINDFSLPTQRINGIMYYGKTAIPFFFIITLVALILMANRQKLIETFRKY